MSPLRPIITAVLLSICGFILLALSTQFEPYKDKAALNEAATIYPSIIQDSKLASKEYRRIREENLTEKFELQDYGMTLQVIAIAIAAICRIGKTNEWSGFLSLKTPREYWKIVVVGIIATIGFALSGVVALFVDASRGMFPWWTVSLGIPLMGAPGVLLFGFLIVLLFSSWAKPGYQGGFQLSTLLESSTRPSMGWIILLGPPVVLFSLLSILSILTGDFIFIPPLLLFFLYFFLLLSGHQKLTDK